MQAENTSGGAALATTLAGLSLGGMSGGGGFGGISIETPTISPSSTRHSRPYGSNRGDGLINM